MSFQDVYNINKELNNNNEYISLMEKYLSIYKNFLVSDFLNILI